MLGEGIETCGDFRWEWYRGLRALVDDAVAVGEVDVAIAAAAAAEEIADDLAAEMVGRLP